MSTRSGDTMGRERADEGHRARVRRLVEEACNKGNLSVLDEVLARPARLADEQITEAGAPPRLRPLLAEFRAAVPDARWTIVEQIAQGDSVVTRLSVRAPSPARCWGWCRRGGRPR